jgi:hypothetical protein
MLLFADDYFPENPLPLHFSQTTVSRLSAAVFVRNKTVSPSDVDKK